SHRSSSSLPEGCAPLRISPSQRELIRRSEQVQRAEQALPSYLALHHAGFSVPRLSPDERWALTPPFHPYLRNQLFEDVSQVSLLDATVLRSTGGLFSVALSVTPFPHWALARCKTASPGVTRRVANEVPTLRPESSVSGLSSPPIARSSDHPAHPLSQLYLEFWLSCG